MAYYYSPFRKDYKKEISNRNCDFCNIPMMEIQNVKYKDGILIENEYYRFIVTWYPKFEGHTMVVPKRHITKLEEESDEERKSRDELIIFATEVLHKLYPKSGTEIFLQKGDGSEASMNHLHWHIVPALPDDKFRSFEKLGHFYTIKEGEEKVVMFPVEIKLAREGLLSALANILGNKE